jgi:putative FmdB family regulatory protein
MLYEHKCPKCNHEQETLCPVDKRLEQTCPVCGETLALQISKPGPAKWLCDTGTATQGKATRD